jgi:hypothetical protein
MPTSVRKTSVLPAWALNVSSPTQAGGVETDRRIGRSPGWPIHYVRNAEIVRTERVSRMLLLRFDVGVANLPLQIPDPLTERRV